ncbi:hypothetical protein AVEN_179096-1 [Araneus ventricosus]|uniref:DUF4817 domain-containing protein n=1 Tax=Araneus ventricosus TaxID=182803 RepID=A0A4Y2F5L0_ARAVE|nr:hypothetical protein AVEN_179096-1 [Araneus ventricosus]
MEYLSTLLLLNCTVFLTSHWLSPSISKSSNFFLHPANSPLSLTSTLRTSVVHSHLDSSAPNWAAAKDAATYLNWIRPSPPTRPAPESREERSRSLSSSIYKMNSQEFSHFRRTQVRHAHTSFRKFPSQRLRDTNLIENIQKF